MAYIEPNSIVQLFKGINLDNRYMHTIYFGSVSAQNTWFSGKVFKTYQRMSYQRYGTGQLKVKEDATTLLGVTYMRFMNDRTNDKWFYAFVNGIEYLNENTALITYEIDVMQTWFIQNGSVRPCMVLREHVNDDTFGINLEHEPIGSEEYDSDFIQYQSDYAYPTDLFREYALVVNTTGEPNDGTTPAPTGGNTTPAYPMLNNNMFIGTKTYVLPVVQTNTAQLKSILSDIMGGNWDERDRKEDVIDMFTFPLAFASYDYNNNFHQMTVTHPHNLDGYVPKNNKLFGYPFSYLQLTDKNGNGATYRWEYFDGMLATNDTVEFDAYGSPIGGGSIWCYPRVYNGVEDNIDAKIALNDFPKNPYSYDAYEAFVASGGKTRLETANKITNVRGIISLISGTSNAINSNVQGANQFTTGVLEMQTGNSVAGLSQAVQGVNKGIQGTTGLANDIVNFVEARNKINYAWNDAYYTPNQVVGSQTPNLAVASYNLNFYFYSVHVRNDELKRLDDFLSCFGYAVNKVKAPNLTGRQYWNFVQTQNCVIAGDMPASSKEAIARIFDGGITFWHNGDNVGNYAISTSSGTINNPIV